MNTFIRVHKVSPGGNVTEALIGTEYIASIIPHNYSFGKCMIQMADGKEYCCEETVEEIINSLIVPKKELL